MKKFILLLSLILAGSCQAQFVINGTVSASSTIPWVTLTNPPTTLAGYGITNAAVAWRCDVAGHWIRIQ